MGSGYSFEGAVVWAAVVDVQPNRDHLAQHVDRRLHVRAAFLLRPASVAGNLVSFLYGDREVLMPADRPICALHFVEHNPADGEHLLAEDFFRESSDVRLAGKASQLRVAESIAVGEGCSRSGVGRATEFCVERFPQGFYLGGCENVGHDCEPISGEVGVKRHMCILTAGL